jgi:hypothetical protein
MTDREKLVALIKEGDCSSLTYGECSRCKYGCKGDCSYQFLADHCLANGVVVREWIPVTERLPENSRHVLICRATGRVSIGHIPLYGVGVDVSYWYKDGLAKFHDVVSYRLVGVTHWMPLPEPPMRKGENDG